MATSATECKCRGWSTVKSDLLGWRSHTCRHLCPFYLPQFSSFRDFDQLWILRNIFFVKDPHLQTILQFYLNGSVFMTSGIPLLIFKNTCTKFTKFTRITRITRITFFSTILNFPQATKALYAEFAQFANKWRSEGLSIINII